MNNLIDLNKLNNEIKNNVKEIKDITKFINKHKEYIDYFKNTKYESLRNYIKCILLNININLVGNCIVCGKELNIKQILHKSKCCSFSCRNKSPEWKEKFKQACLQKYGVENPSLSKEIRNKANNTIFKKYGVYNAYQAKEIKQKIKEKITKTNLQKYGVKYLLQSNIIRQKCLDTCIKKYGTKYPIQNKEIKAKFLKSILSNNTKQKRINTCLNLYNVKYATQIPFVIDKMQLTKKINYFNKKILNFSLIPKFDLNFFINHNLDYKFNWQCKKCNKTFKQHLSNGNIPCCPKCYPKNYKYSNLEKELVAFLNNIYIGEIQENRRYLITPQELDIIIPDKKIAIEFNGIYWHSDKIIRDSNYHLNKTKSCEKVGYRLIHIWEYDWINPIKQNILKEKLKAILDIDQEKIYARKCNIKEISTKDKNNFLNLNHIQGKDRSNIKLGLYYNEELIAVMTFGKPRFNKNYEWQLIRYATKSGYKVLGGAGKLLKYFERNYNPKSIITYADISYSQGNMYRKIGFNELNPSSPNYYYVKENIILSRYQCQKHKLIKILGDKFNKNLSENENMLLNGYNKIYDCGNLIFIKNF